MNKITVIGTGSVGSTIAYTLTINGLASEIVMIDINGEKALGEALDIRQGTPFCNPCTVYAGSYPDAAGSDIVVITSGVARKPGQTRLDLAQTNVNILKSITPEITKYAPDATYVIVSNPVDVLTYVFTKISGIPEERVIGSGTILDTARLRARLAEYYKVSQHNVHAYVLGEHGESQFVPWSIANISNVPVQNFRDSLLTKTMNIYPDLEEDAVEEYVRKSGASVIKRKGATFYAVSMSVCHICKCLLSGIDTTLTVSNMLHGEYGIDDVCLSLLNIVGKNGAHSKVMLPLNDEEIGELRHSAECLKNIIKEIQF
ncbi:MAG: L-lactate dehydrogenase [Clostridia bacterium]|nr:L-lactate dehydrogenase [Clostridia bacterium]